MTFMKLEIEIPDDLLKQWLEYLLDDGGAFQRSTSGYWLYGAKQHTDGSWLAYEQGDDRLPRVLLSTTAASWRDVGMELPPRFFVLDKAFAIRAFAEGVKRGGLEWWQDGPSADAAVQMAMFGELRYG